MRSIKVVGAVEVKKVNHTIASKTEDTAHQKRI